MFDLLYILFIITEIYVLLRINIIQKINSKISKIIIY